METTPLRTALLGLTATILLVAGFLYVGSTMAKDDLAVNLEFSKR